MVHTDDSRQQKHLLYDMQKQLANIHQAVEQASLATTPTSTTPPVVHKYVMFVSDKEDNW